MARVLEFGDSGHSRLRQLLPWYANGTLGEEDRQAVDGHLVSCERCRTELADLRELERLLGEEAADAAAEAGFARIEGRLGAGSNPLEGMRRLLGSRGSRRAAWAAVPLLAVAVLAVMLWAPPADPPPYRTLSAPDRVRAERVVARFAPGSAEAAVRAVLLQAGARIVDGPTANGLYVLESPAGAAPLVSALKSSGLVESAETLEVR